MATVNLQAATREGTGKGVARKLRQAERIPAVLYGLKADPIHLSLDDIEFRKAMSTGAGSRAVLRLAIDGAKEAKVAIVKEIQRHPVSRRIVHTDLISIDLSTPIDISVPIKPIGTPVGVRTDGGNLQWQRRELEIRVLPTAIPEEIELDISEMQVNDVMHVGDIKAEGFEILEAEDLTICAVASMSLVEETTEEDVEGEEGAEGAEGADADASSEDSSD
jgi:large subunit ribosomal protein L25